MAANRSLDELVTVAASHLMGVTATTLGEASEQLLRELVGYFDVDLSFFRRNDHTARTTILVAEWPPRPHVPEPDPLGVVSFAGADRTFAATEHLSTVMITHPDGTDDDYQDTIRRGSGLPGSVSSVTVPLLSIRDTMGVLGFVTFGDREWRNTEINALRAVAALLTQVEARVAAEERLRSMAYHDELTGLANRRALIDHLNQRMVVGAAGPVALIFLDVDRLKALNSVLGHVSGDQYLKTLAHRLSAASNGHLVARLGGDEFVLVMQHCADESVATLMAEELRRVAVEPIPLGGEEVSRGVSVGVATGTPGALTVSRLMGQADQAMHQSKARGGNTISVFTTEMRRRNEIRTAIELHLGTAIGNGSLVLHYQPEVDLVSGRILGFEALVRWPHPTLGLLPPGEFIAIAEATNLAGELGRWVIETACRQLKKWQHEYRQPTLGMSVNVSPAQLITLDFVTTVSQILDQCGLQGRYLTLEITEQAVLRDTEQALITLRGLKDIGVKVAIDDFGTGYSSLAQLKALPVDTLKIDQGFVRELGVSADDLAIVTSIVGLARSFGLQLVAEGVETTLSAATLLDLGCTRAQGFLFAKPLTAQDAEWALEHETPNHRPPGPHSLPAHD
ncbi:putative bifunctional diguanylate cyclase/phosphodiesterase [Nakamurella sp. GG22]